VRVGSFFPFTIICPLTTLPCRRAESYPAERLEVAH
jgi:hypothetical protein